MKFFHLSDLRLSIVISGKIRNTFYGRSRILPSGNSLTALSLREIFTIRQCPPQRQWRCSTASSPVLPQLCRTPL